MATWHDYLITQGTPPEWPYPIKYGEEAEYEARNADYAGVYRPKD